MDVEITTPEEYFGDVMGNVSSKRGQIRDSEERGTAKLVRCFIPLSEMFGYATELRSLTQGRASYSMQFDHYEKVPGGVAQEIIEQRS
jgi:elongation factor G